jgi:hypothetical protein
MQSFTYSAPKPRRRLKVTAMVLGWCMIAATSFALFNRLAAGTVNISTTSPDSVPLTLVGSVNFTQAGQTRPLVLEADGTAVNDGDESYTSFHFLSGGVASGPCAGLVAIGGPGAVAPVTWRNSSGVAAPLTVGMDGNVRRTADGASGEQIEVTLDPSAGPACQDQPNIPLDVTLTLIP